MNLRDEVAFKAFGIYLALKGTDGEKARNDPAALAKWSYEHADEFLKARAKKPTKKEDGDDG